MNIQIFGKSKCFDTKKAQRYFKERGIKYQFIDIMQTEISAREFESILKSVGSIDKLINENAPGVEILQYLATGREEKLMDNPKFLKTPIVRNGKVSTAGYAEDIWKTFE